jgi:hypothetical protein
MMSDMLAGFLIGYPDYPRPNWCGFMQHVSVDLDSNDYSSIYSTLVVFEQQDDHLYMDRACVTFGELPWIKAVAIVKTQTINEVCTLGGFYILISFHGSIRKLVDGSGLCGALPTCCSSECRT